MNAAQRYVISIEAQGGYPPHEVTVDSSGGIDSSAPLFSDQAMWDVADAIVAARGDGTVLAVHRIDEVNVPRPS